MPKVHDRNHLCAFCAQPVRYAHLPRGKSQWVHSNPLGEMKVSVTESNRV